MWDLRRIEDEGLGYKVEGLAMTVLTVRLSFAYTELHRLYLSL